MQRRTAAFLAIWHDIDPAMEAEWQRWHTYEHMPERVAIPGFLAGRRYMADDAPRDRCFTLYEGESLAVFNSPAYLERLNAPTGWTRRMAPAFRNFTRGACRRVATAGAEHGHGGAVLTVRLVPDGTPDEAAAAALAGRIAGIPGVTGAHVGVCDRGVTKTETNERALRSGTGEHPLDGTVVVEGYEMAALQAAAAAIVTLVGTAGLGFRADACQAYRLAYLLQA